MIRRSVLVSTTAASALLLCATALTSTAGVTSVRPAAGRASSALSLFTATAGGHVLRVGDVALLSDTLSGSPISTVVVTPLTVDGAAAGTHTVTPASARHPIPVQSSPSALSGFAALTSPSFTASATNVPSSAAGAASLGSVSLLGLPVPFSGSLELGSTVNAKTGAVGFTTVVLKNLALPSLGELLAALGLDVSKLPGGTLGDLVRALDLATPAVTVAQAAVDAVSGQVQSTRAAVAGATAALSKATQSAGAAATVANSATAALVALLAQLPPGTVLALPGANTIAGYASLPAASQAVVNAAVPGVASAFSALTTAATARTAAQRVLGSATATLGTLQVARDALQATLTSTLAPLRTLLTGVLDSTPLVSLDSLSMTSKAAAASNTAGGQTAQLVGGDLTGFKVLGSDVFDHALGTSTIGLADLTNARRRQVMDALGGLTGTLSEVLSNVPGFPALSIPAPQIALLTQSASTSIVGGFGKASTTVTGLQITLPAITLPGALALPGAASLPAFAGGTQAAGLLLSGPVSLSMASLSGAAAFRPAVLPTAPAPTGPLPTTPGTAGPGLPPTGLPPAGLAPTGLPPTGLPRTGLPVGGTMLSLVLLGGVLGWRRRVAWGSR